MKWSSTAAGLLLRVLAALAVAPLASQDALATDVPFQTEQIISMAASAPHSVFAADVDGDGDIDALSASRVDNKIAWYENDGTPGGIGDWTEHVISTLSAGARSVFAADLDADGDLDVLSASADDDKIAWYENLNGAGSFGPQLVISTAADYALSVIAADVNGDGDLDVLSASWNDGKIAWYENDGSPGGLGDWAAHVISTATINVHQVFAADLDGDGDIDVLSASASDNKIAWYENLDGAGAFGPQQIISSAAAGAWSVFAADVDGDGDIDVLSASVNDNKIAWYENLYGVGIFGPEQVISTDAASAWWVFAADMDSDGDADVLSASPDDSKVAWYENDGTPSDGGWTPRTISTAANYARAVVAADVDGDGDTDVLSASELDNKIAWYKNGTIHRSASFPQRVIVSTTADGVRSVFSADVDGDGDMDALSGSQIDGQVVWYENLDGAGGFGPPEVIYLAAGEVYSVFAADVDGDGDTDVLSATGTENRILWHENDGALPPAWTTRVVSASANNAWSVFAADVDGDGDQDVLSASFYDHKISWYQNNGASPPVFTEHVISTSALNAISVFAADLDGDGDMDVLSAAFATGTIAWYRNLDGAGSFGPPTILASVDHPRKVMAADVDGDGDADVLTASQGDNRIAWYENLDGAGTFGPQRIISATAAGAASVFAADLDGDGDTDVLSASQSDNKIAWYANDGGSPPGWTERPISTAAADAFSVFASDLDRDGDLDALSGSYVDDTIAWYPNRGGQFSLTTINVTPPVLPPGAINAVLKIVVTHQGRPGDTDVELATLDLVFHRLSLGLPGTRNQVLTSAEANALVETLFVYRDNGDGIFTPGDVAVTTIGTLTLVSGRQTVTFADGDPSFRVAQGLPRTYFVALQIASDAPNQIPNDFRVIHSTESSSSAEDAAADIRLKLEFVANAPSGPISFPPRVVSVVPQDNALGVPVGTNVTVIFSEPVDSATVAPSTIRLIGPGGAPVVAGVGLAPGGMTATLDPKPAGGALAFATPYTVSVTSGVTDVAGIPAVPFTSRFATAPGQLGGTPLPSVSDQSVLPGPPPGPAPGGLSSSAVLIGETVGPNLGFSVTAAGDLNNDGLADFVGGAPGFTLSGMAEAGAAAIYLGSNAPEPPSGNHPREVADVIFTGQAPHDRAGTSVAAGFDFNGDGIGDILVGAEQVNRSGTNDPVCNNNSACGPGKVYLIFFKPMEYDFPPQNGIPDYLERSEVFVPLSLVGAGISGVVFTGATQGDQAGYAVAAGGRLDSADGLDDIVIGAPGASKAYVVFSSSGVSGLKNLVNVGSGIPGRVYQGSPGERLGASVALPGDVTDPEGPDIALGAPLADTTQVDAGRVYVVAAGSLTMGTPVDASMIATQIDGDQACEQLGFAVAGGGDNLAGGSPVLPGGDPDLLIGAPYYDAFSPPVTPCPDPPLPKSGRVIQTTGRLSGGLIASHVGSLLVEGVIWKGVQAGGGLGWSVARLGDLTGNNLDDIGLGAPFASPGVSGAGAVYVIEGSANTGLLGSIDADQVGQIVSGGIFLGTQLGEEAGLALCAAGDLDGDGLSGSPTADDFTVGSPGWNASLGTVHQVLGTLLQQPGECTALGCTVADLATGAVLVVPPNALAQGTKFRFTVVGLASLPASCGSHALSGKSLVGSSDNSRTDCATPPCPPPGFALRPAIEVPTRQELEYQLAQGEPLALRYCDATFGWTPVPGGPATGLVQDNSFVAGRKAVAASGVDTLRRYGVFFDDLDHDDVRDACDCSPGDATRWSAPGPAGDLLFGIQGPSPAPLTWGLPACTGGAPGALFYDTIRSTKPQDFINGAVCVEANGFDTSSVDPVNPPPGQVFYYIVSPENGCLSGPACLDPACVQPPARDC